MDGCRARSFVARPAITRLAGMSAGILLLSSVGCTTQKLETGYAYSPLGASSVQRRAYYAGPFSPEARQAMSEPGAADTGGASDMRHARPGM